VVARGSSYPIRILDEKKVRVLVSSKQLGERYGEAPVFITFDHGEGKVYHMISHFYFNGRRPGRKAKGERRQLPGRKGNLRRVARQV